MREDDSHSAALRIVEQFVDEILIHQQLHSETIPSYFNDALERLQEVIDKDEGSKICKDSFKSYFRRLQNYLLLNIFGFFSG